MLEDFDPINRIDADPFWWIPQGLMWDLMDVRNELRITGGPIDDNVSGYTVQQLNNALSGGIRSPQQYRDRLLQQNGFDQAVINLFEQYGY